MSTSERVIQIKAKDALLALDQIFKNNGISFFLLSGTTLGAIRHGDMIPWDDDIDIGIFNRDYKRATECIINDLPCSYTWIDQYTDQDYPRLHGKILYQGIGVIDIFPLVKTSNYKIMQRKQWAEKKLLHKLYKTKKYYREKNRELWVKKVKHKGLSFIARVISLFFSEAFLLKMLSSVANRYEKKNNPQYYFNIFSIYSMKKERIPSEWLEYPSVVRFFGKEFLTVGNCDQYLKNLYGDYMTLPPKEQRVPNHTEIYG